MTSEELANLAHLRRARDLMDREYARPLEVAELARAALSVPGCLAKDVTRPSRKPSRNGETGKALAA